MRAPSAIGITAGPLHRWVYVNMARATMAGRTKLEDFVGKTVRESYPELAGQPFFAALDGVYTTGIPFIGKELKATFNRGPGGAPEVAYVDCVYQPIRDEEAGWHRASDPHGGGYRERCWLAGRSRSPTNAKSRRGNELESRVAERTLHFSARMRHCACCPGGFCGRKTMSAAALARELHDSAGQYLCSIQMNLSAIAKEVTGSSPSLRGRLDDAIDLVERCTSEIRTLLLLLHPPLLDELGLTSALSWYVEGFQSAAGLK